jgi:hypothetical protein
MLKAWSGWREFKTALLSGLLVLFAIGPALQDLVCADGPATASAGLQLSDSAPNETTPGDLDPATGVHVHCDHGGVQDHAFTTAAAVVFPLADGHALDRQRIVVANRQFGLDRPPRA